MVRPFGIAAARAAGGQRVELLFGQAGEQRHPAQECLVFFMRHTHLVMIRSRL